MALSCSLKKNSLCVLEIVASILWLIVLWSLLMSSSFFKSERALSIALFDLKGFEHLLKLLAARGRERDGKVSQSPWLGEIGVTQKDLELLFEERIEFEQFLDRRDDADRIGFEFARKMRERRIVVILHLGLQML